MSDKKFERFGKYLILDHLVDGGMAKICRARFLGEQANKIVAIKMVQAQFSRDPSFVRMFQDELSVTFSLQHPNIAQTFDYGKVGEQLYTAMEYVDGANLKQFLDRLKEKNYVFPVEISIYIISQMCQGLHYAHTFQDKLSGKPLHIVHRDISPHNVMLTYDGAVKVIDFGIAKSNSNSEATQAGTIKGKLSYLAPEYLDGMDLDHRYDQFAVGITLWEMLCSRKLFTAANDLAVLKQIQACKITPPSQINPNVPKELDAIVMKALSKDRNLRFDDMDKFNRSLVKFLYAQYPDFNPSDLAYFAKELFKDEIKRDKEKFVDYGKIDVTPYLEAIKYEETMGTPSPGAPVAQAPVAQGGKDELKRIERIEIDMDNAQGDKSLTNIELNREGVVSRRNPGGLPKSDTRKIQRPAGLSAGAGATRVLKPEDDSGERPVGRKALGMEKTGTTAKTLAKIKQQPKAVDTKGEVSTSTFMAIVVASVLGVAYLQADFVEGLTGINLQKMISGDSGVARTPAAPGPSVDPSAPEGPEERGRVSLGGVDLEMEIFLDGVKHSYGLGTPIKVPLGRDITVTVKKQGYEPFNKTLRLTVENSTAFIEVPELVKARSGLLSSSLNYPSGSLLVYEVSGEKVERQMPFRDVRVPAGSYQATVVNPLLGTEKKVKFTIEENKIHLLE